MYEQPPDGRGRIVVRQLDQPVADAAHVDDPAFAAAVERAP